MSAQISPAAAPSAPSLALVLANPSVILGAPRPAMAVGKHSNHCKSKGQSFLGKRPGSPSEKVSVAVLLAMRRRLATFEFAPKKRVRFADEVTEYFIPPREETRFFNLHYHREDYAQFKASAKEEIARYRKIYTSLSVRQVLTVLYQPNDEDRKSFNECSAPALQRRIPSHLIPLIPMKSLYNLMTKTVRALLLPRASFMVMPSKTGAVAMSCMCWWLLRSSLPRL